MTRPNPQENRTLKQDLAAVLNTHSIDNRTNTPDHVLAQFVAGLLIAYDVASSYRTDPKPEDSMILSPGLAAIAEERQKAIDAGHTAAQDDVRWPQAQLARAAAMYATPRQYRLVYDVGGRHGRPPFGWPMLEVHWKPDNDGINGRLHELAKAGALIAAEIDRLTRLTQREHAADA